MNNVLSLVPPKTDGPDADLIADIEALLGEAKSGDLQGIAYAAMYANHEFKADWNGRSAALPMNGAIAMLAHDFAEAINQIPEEPE